jgi:hypothetical protein
MKIKDEDEIRLLADQFLAVCQKRKAKPSIAMQAFILALAGTLRVTLPKNIEEALQMVNHKLRDLCEQPDEN